MVQVRKAGAGIGGGVGGGGVGVGGGVGADAAGQLLVDRGRAVLRFFNNETAFDEREQAHLAAALAATDARTRLRFYTDVKRYRRRDRTSDDGEQSAALAAIFEV